MQQRYYDPAVGRFLSADPMSSDMQNGWNFNRYNYAANNPYKFKDPDGRIIETVWDAGNVVMGVVSAYDNFSSGKPNQNAYIESFNGRLRDECLNEHWFQNVLHARTVIETWRREYNEERPKKALGGLTPAAYAKRMAEIGYPNPGL